MSLLVLPHTIDAGTEITAVEHQANYTAIRDLLNGELEGGVGQNFKADGVTARELADILMVQGFPGQGGVAQEGVFAASHLAVTPGANLVLNYASGTGWVADDSGVIASGALVPAVVSGSTVTIAANSSGNPRIDQIILTLSGFGTGTVSVLQGTATAAADLTNRNGAAALPAGAIRLADILMPNGFAGPFVQATHIRDRRPWARGAFIRVTAGAGTTDNVGTPKVMDGTNLFARLELQGNPVLISLQAQASMSVAERGQFGYFIDGASFYTRAHYLQTNPAEVNKVWSTVPAAGSHSFAPSFASFAAGTVTLDSAVGQIFVVEEIVRQNTSNSGA